MYLGDHRASLPVPEWGDEGRPLLVYWKPWTLADHARCYGGVADKKIDARVMGEVVFNKAENAKGERLFSEPLDLHILQAQSDQSVVSRIAAAIMMAPTVTDAVAALQNDSRRRTMFYLADKLGKSIDEIELWSVKQFNETIAFYEVKRREEKNAS